MNVECVFLYVLLMHVVNFVITIVAVTILSTQ